MEIRFTTRIALALLVAVILALTIYAYPSFAGFTTLVFRAAAIVGAIAVVVLLIAAFTRRKPGRLDLLLVLSAIGLVAASWPQISAVADRNALEREIAEAGEENVAAVIAATETKAGEAIRDVAAVREAALADLEALLPPLWTEGVEQVIDGPNATDAALRAGAVDRLAELRQATEDAAAEVDAIVDDAILATNGGIVDPEADADPDAGTGRYRPIEIGLPDSARLTLIDAAIQRLEADRAFYKARLAFADQRLTIAEEIVAFLDEHAEGFTFNTATQRVQFADREAGIDYEALLVDLEQAREGEDEIVAHYAGEETAQLLTLVEAAGATP